MVKEAEVFRYSTVFVKFYRKVDGKYGGGFFEIMKKLKRGDFFYTGK